MHEKIREKAEFGIVTFYHGNYNFGGLLQAYALPAALEKYLGISAEQVDYVFGPKKQPRSKYKVSVKGIINTAGFLILNLLKRNGFNRRKAAFDEYIEYIPHSKGRYDSDCISGALNEYTGFLCGGDQIWNDCLQFEWFSIEDSRVFTLCFVPDNRKKVSYAPSMAALELTPEFDREFQKGIKRLDAISVREKTALPVLRGITDKSVTVTVDPVLLLQENDWLKEICYVPRRKYVLCYLLGDSMLQRKAAERFARTVLLPILTFPHIGNVVRKCDLFFGDICDYTSGPREFLGLIKNAEFVITDSFHACVFSMIFQKPFAVFERHNAGEKGNMNSRIYDFLEEYHLEDRLVTEDVMATLKEIPKVDYTYAHAHWKKRRDESLAFLEHALKENENGAES